METKCNIYPNCCCDSCFFKVYDSIKFGVAQQWNIKLLSLHIYPLVYTSVFPWTNPTVQHFSGLDDLSHH